jgi:hypothetical protein
MPSIPGSTGVKDTERTAGEGLTEGEADDDATGVSAPPDAPSSPPSPPHAANSTPDAASSAMNVRGIRMSLPSKHTQIDQRTSNAFKERQVLSLASYYCAGK